MVHLGHATARNQVAHLKMAFEYHPGQPGGSREVISHPHHCTGGPWEETESLPWELPGELAYRFPGFWGTMDR